METDIESTPNTEQLLAAMREVPIREDIISPTCVVPEGKHFFPTDHVEFITPAVLPTPYLPANSYHSRKLTIPSSPSLDNLDSPTYTASKTSYSVPKSSFDFKKQEEYLSKGIKYTSEEESIPQKTISFPATVTGVAGNILATGMQWSAHAIPDLDKVIEEKVAMQLVSSRESFADLHSVESRLKSLEKVYTSSIQSLQSKKPILESRESESEPSLSPPSRIGSDKYNSELIKELRDEYHSLQYQMQTLENVVRRQSKIIQSLSQYL
ncbi:hypothetical protein ADUPG1_000343 [Aduncisulcus paluster]|uniref:Uncharacterized protein n=1 Tax=Aduncisulcus paluster TaxID=2918883 RepID=A0ABQ5K943_9EUKA|nr:hypothetical protein ADUPG1_000343 [Aduncisulcus paluster]